MAAGMAIPQAVKERAAGLIPSTELKALYQKITQHDVLGKAHANVIEDTMLEALDRHRAGKLIMDGEAWPLTIDHVEKAYHELVDARRTQKVNPNKFVNGLKTASGVVAKKKEGGIKTIENLKSNWSHLPSGDKLNIGIVFTTAGLCGLDAMVSGAKAVEKDPETGKSHLRLGNLGIALVEGVLAVGAAYLGAQMMRGKSI